jgi:hypothetical protein
VRTYRQGEAWIAYQDAHPAAEIRRGGMCQWFARNAWGAAPFGITAYQAWLSIPASHRHTGAPPPGAICYWKGGSSGAGHAAPAVESHKIWSTDLVHHGQIDKVPYTQVAEQWGQHYLGWIDWTPSGKLPILSTVVPKPVVHVSRVQPGAHNNEVLVLQKALSKEPQVGLDYSSGPGIFGDRTKAAYQKWQRHLGFSGSDADGKPGITSLTNLAGRHGFRAAP